MWHVQLEKHLLIEIVLVASLITKTDPFIHIVKLIYGLLPFVVGETERFLLDLFTKTTGTTILATNTDKIRSITKAVKVGLERTAEQVDLLKETY